MHNAQITFEHPRADVIESTVRPESKGEFPRTSIRISRQNHMLIIAIESSDINGLRAAINSYIRWMDMAVTITDRIGG